jgi:hypothetical protein
MQLLALQTQTVFAELAERVLAREAVRSVSHLAGTFTTKYVRDRAYWYFKASQPGSGQREYYLGPETPALTRVLETYQADRPAARIEDAEIEHLCAMLRAGGAMLTDHVAARVLRALGDAGVFRLGGVLVGTYAYLVLGNTLGVRWARATRTQDIDIAARRTITISVPPLDADVPSARAGLELGFLPVPGFDPREPSTSFHVRGRELRVDFLTPASGRPTANPFRSED